MPINIYIEVTLDQSSTACCSQYLRKTDILSSDDPGCGYQRCDPARNSPGTTGNCDNVDICTENP